MNNTEVNEYIKNTVLTKLADIIDGIIKDAIKDGVENKIKTLINEFQAKITDIVIKKEGGLIVKSTVDAELKKINDEMDKFVLKCHINPDVLRLTLAFF